MNIEDIGKELSDKNQDTAPKPEKCEWCDGACHINELHYATVRTEFDRIMYQGWYSPECHWLAMQARDAVERDKS